MQPVTDHCAVMHQSNNLQAMPTAQLLSSRTTFCICGDNIDKSTKPRYMRYGQNKANSIHYFHSYAVADRINVSNLSETAPPLQSLCYHLLKTTLPFVITSQHLSHVPLLTTWTFLSSLLMELWIGTSHMSLQQKCQRNRKV